MGNVPEGQQPSQVSKSCRQNGLDYEAKSNKSYTLLLSLVPPIVV